MRRIEIDDEVYAELEKHVQGFEQPNDVLRRLILRGVTGGSAERPADAASRKRGGLYPLVVSGTLDAGDELKHVQPRKGRTFTATVDEDGFIVTPIGRYTAASPALKDLVGSEINGKVGWTHSKTGKTLKDLGA
ncbi:hypothetical protein [Cellulosimicrobium funkei]|uniref:hypothetical protein n=1 Tax=Cellulosimicrobium funkei TaxID=264251 RepID=UPI003435AF47